jgi:hypothetical protein
MVNRMEQFWISYKFNCDRNVREFGCTDRVRKIVEILIGFDGLTAKIDEQNSDVILLREYFKNSSSIEMTVRATFYRYDLKIYTEGV